MRKSLATLLSAFTCALAFGPASGATADEATLYERLGGEPVVASISEQTLRAVATNPAVNQSFDGVSLAKLAPKLASHLCSLTGGGCPPPSDSIRTVHAGLNISERELYAMVEALRAALDANGVGEREKNELLRLLAPLKRDVVTR